MNMMPKGRVTGIDSMLSSVANQTGTPSVLLRPMTVMSTAHKLTTRWLMPRKFWSTPPIVNQAQSHGRRKDPTTSAAIPPIFTI